MGAPAASPALFTSSNEESNELPDMVASPLENVLTESFAASPEIIMSPGIQPPDTPVTRERVAQAKFPNAPNAYRYKVPSSAREYGAVYPYAYPGSPSPSNQGRAFYRDQPSSPGSSTLLNQNSNTYQYNIPSGRATPLATNYGAYYQQGAGQRNAYKSPGKKESINWSRKDFHFWGFVGEDNFGYEREHTVPRQFLSKTY